MLIITIPETELFNEDTQEFIKIRKQTISLEHSLVSISKWESKWKKAFLGKEEKTQKELLDYIKCMTVTPNVSDVTYLCLTSENLNAIKDYINDTMTATTFSNHRNGPPSREIITSEIIYYWMIALDIPFECQKWHLNRLLTLINVCSIKNAPAKKMSRKDAYSQQNALNAARRAKYNSKG